MIHCGFHIMNSGPPYLYVLLHLPSALATSPITNGNVKENPKDKQYKETKPSRNKNKTKQQQQQNKESCHGSYSVSLWVTQLYPLVSSSIHLYLQVFIAMNHWFSWRPLALVKPVIMGSYSDFSWISCCCPVSLRSCCCRIFDYSVNPGGCAN